MTAASLWFWASLAVVLGLTDAYLNYPSVPSAMQGSFAQRGRTSCVTRRGGVVGLRGKGEGGLKVSELRMGLMDWAKEQGVDSGPIEVATFDGGLRGMRARKNVKSGEDLISVPDSVVLRIVGDTPGYPKSLNGIVSADVWKGIPWFAKLALLIIREQRNANIVSSSSTNKNEGRLREWVEALPKSLDTPLHWTSEQLEALEYVPMVDAVNAQKTQWRTIYDKIKASASSPPTEKEFYHACELARSRAFSGPYTSPLPKEQFFLLGTLIAGSIQFHLMSDASAIGGGVLVVLGLLFQSLGLPRLLNVNHYVISPVIDMINHNGKQSSEVTYAPFQRSFVVISSQDYKAGDQVFISYGKRSNDQLLQFYGFVERENPHDVYQIDRFVPRVRERLPSVNADKVMEARDQGYEGGAQAFLTKEGLNEPSMKLLTFLCGGDEAKARDVIRSIAEEEKELINQGMSTGAAQVGLTAREKGSQELAQAFLSEKRAILDAVLSKMK